MRKFTTLENIINEDVKKDAVIENQYELITALIDNLLKIQVVGVVDPIIKNNAIIGGKKELVHVLVSIFNNPKLLNKLKNIDFTNNLVDIYNVIEEKNEDYLYDIQTISDISKLESLLEVTSFFGNNMVTDCIIKRITELNYGKS